jgi:hypothetical protein
MMVVLTVKAKLRAHSYYDLGAPTPSREQSFLRKGVYYTKGVCKHACRVERTKIIKF